MSFSNRGATNPWIDVDPPEFPWYRAILRGRGCGCGRGSQGRRSPSASSRTQL